MEEHNHPKRLLLTLALIVIVTGCSQPKADVQQTGTCADPIYKRAQLSHFMLEADYAGTGSALTSGATQASLDISEAIQKKDLKQALRIIQANRASFRKAVAVDREKAKAMAGCSLPNGLSDAEQTTLRAVCQYSEVVHTQQAAAFENLLQANEGNLIKKLNDYIDHRNKQFEVSAKAEAEARTIPN